MNIKMKWRRIINWFRDSSLRKKFIDNFNENAQRNFHNLSVNALLKARTCAGNPDDRYRHELSAPVIASGFIIEVIAGDEIPQEDIFQIGKTVLYSESVVRWLWALHWDTLIIKDVKTNRYGEWAIKDFVHLGGLLDAVKTTITHIDM